MKTLSDLQNEPFEKFGALIQDIRIAMLTTLDEEGILRSRPMATLKNRIGGHLWFLTAVDSPKVDAIQSRSDVVNLSYADPEHQRYVSVSGNAYLVREPKILDQLWKPTFQAWFPEGRADPRLAALRVEVFQAEYWDTPSGKMVQLLGLVKALTQGKGYEPSRGENEKINISG